MRLHPRHKKFDANKLYCSEILSILLQSRPKNCRRMGDVEGEACPALRAVAFVAASVLVGGVLSADGRKIHHSKRAQARQAETDDGGNVALPLGQTLMFVAGGGSATDDGAMCLDIAGASRDPFAQVQLYRCIEGNLRRSGESRLSPTNLADPCASSVVCRISAWTLQAQAIQCRPAICRSRYAGMGPPKLS